MAELSVSQAKPEPSHDALKQMFGDVLEMLNGLAYWSADLNGDGIADHILVTVQGTLREETLYVKPGNSSARVIEQPDELYTSDEPAFDVISANGRDYIFDGGGLWKLTANNELQPLCGFKQAGKPIVDLIVGKETPVCALLMAGGKTLPHVSYSLAHRLGDKLPEEERFGWMNPLPGLAKVDLNNDGKEENVVRLSYVNTAGRGCSSTYIAVTDEAKAVIPDTKLNKILLEDIANSGGLYCFGDLNVNTFVDHGVTYVDALGSESHTVYQIKHDKATKVCETQVRPIFEPVMGKRQ